MKQQEYFSSGSIRNLRNILNQEDVENVFLVTGKESYETCGAQKAINKLVPIFTRFYDFSPNPQLNDIKKGYEIFRKREHDIIIGIGGGSAIDVAKAIKIFHYDETRKTIPLVAIPTTAGSGSEATYFIVYYDEKEKQSKGNSKITLPDYVICDPQFTMSLPKKIAASTGMDALSQAIESYWSINSTDKSKQFAQQAIRLLISNLELAVNFPTIDSKEKVMKAANLAGKAINITKTTACHSIAYPITSYFNIPHGHAVGLTLGEMLVYNSEINKKDCLDKRGIDYVKKTINGLVNIFGSNSSSETKEKIKRLMNKIGLQTKLSELNINEEDISLIIERGFNPDRFKNNPRLLTKENLKRELDNIM